MTKLNLIIKNFVSLLKWKCPNENVQKQKEYWNNYQKNKNKNELMYNGLKIEELGRH